ncbi:CBY1-interacting BAR domain-containing protein 1-like [Corticium candelabrum]|uniref:CBY1-interacting BAR domain-containing protein 1-like n=1 Tax=Corticium candelabrum TaxID=121492 RepID=UPI002E26A54B|nr:CBY1-interacting BAR domain-containing protein 1-like [Corticium candelabrum]
MATASDRRSEADAQAKGLQEHIGVVEDNFSSLLQNFAAISRKCGKLRDKGDLLVKSMREYSELETPSVKSSLGACAECFAGLEDYREAMVARLEAKVIQPLTDYGNITKKAREELRARRTALEKELGKQRNLDKITVRDPADASKRHRVCGDARQEVSQAQIQSNRAQKAFEDHMITFETKKIRDLKSVLGEYVQAQMMFHAKALELLTVAFQQVQSIDEEGDLQYFKNKLQLMEDDDLQSHRSRRSTAQSDSGEQEDVDNVEDM